MLLEIAAYQREFIASNNKLASLGEETEHQQYFTCLTLLPVMYDYFCQ